MSAMKKRRALGVAAMAMTLGFGLTACAPPGAGGDADQARADVREEVQLQPDETAEGFDLDALVAAAKQEGPITIYDETGKVTKIAEAFTAKYGIPATGVKMETNLIDKVKRENESGNIIADVLAVSDPATVYTELLKDDIVTNWVPGDVYDKLPEEARYPYLTSGNWIWWTYNPSVYGDTCPVSNIWELTEESYRGLVAMPDPEARSIYEMMWNQAARDHADLYEKAYEERYGEPLKTDQPTAFHEWLHRLAQNSPGVYKSDEEVSEAVGAPGQAKPPIGQMYAAKYRNVADKGYSLKPCESLKPYIAMPSPQTIVYASKSKSPNAAKLYIHFATSQEGMDFITGDGKRSYNPDITVASDPFDITGLIDQAMPYSTSYLEDDYSNVVTWADFWRSSR